MEAQAQALCFQIPTVYYLGLSVTELELVQGTSLIIHLFQLFCRLCDFRLWKPSLQSRTFSYRLATDGRFSSWLDSPLCSSSIILSLSSRHQKVVLRKQRPWRFPGRSSAILGCCGAFLYNEGSRSNDTTIQQALLLSWSSLFASARAMDSQPSVQSIKSNARPGMLHPATIYGHEG